MKERSLVWISGSEPEVLDLLLQQPEIQLNPLPLDHGRYNLWVGAGTQATVVNDSFSQKTASQARNLIGTECKLIIYNAYERFDVDAFAAICGMLVHGGVLYLLTPGIETWAQADQLEMQRFTVFGHTKDELDTRSTRQHKGIQSRYIYWLIDRLYEYTHSMSNAGNERTGQPAELNTTVRKLNLRQIPAPALTRAMKNLAPGLNTRRQNGGITELTRSTANPEQQDILTHWQNPPRISTEGQAEVRILTADRGRGKSALLGMLCANLLTQNTHCVVTGPKRQASDILMRHCKEHLSSKQSGLQPPHCIAPDDLLANTVNTKVLMVDEAAALPLPTLKKLVETYNQVIMATTVHGYEGAGKGFSIRFKGWLQQNNIPFSWKTLKLPVRWLPDDRLEMFCNDAFMLNAEYAKVEHGTIHVKNCSVDFYPADRLLSAPETLRECFALLVQAHYQTKPMDLRHMLDGQNIRTFVLSHDSAVLGTALVAIETLGDKTMDVELRRAIVEKRRRPRGHLLPQLLAQWTQDEKALDLKIARIVRIAIHPEHQNRGLGSHFLKCIEQQLRETTNIDAIGAMFGKDKRVNRYWRQNDYHEFHLGRRKNNRSGTRSLSVIKSLGNPLAIIDRARYLYSINFTATPLAAEYDTDAQAIASRKTLNTEILQAYVKSNRSFEDSRQFIFDFLKDHLNLNNGRAAGLQESESRLIVRATQPGFEFAQCAKELGYAGKKSAEIAFKAALHRLLE